MWWEMWAAYQVANEHIFSKKVVLFEKGEKFDVCKTWNGMEEKKKKWPEKLRTLN